MPTGRLALPPPRRHRDGITVTTCQIATFLRRHAMMARATGRAIADSSRAYAHSERDDLCLHRLRTGSRCHERRTLPM